MPDGEIPLSGDEGPEISGPPRPAIEVPEDLPSGFWEKAMGLEFKYSRAALIVVLACLLGGIVLFVLGVTGSTSWTVKVYGAESKLLDAAPGVVFFVVGLFVLWLTRFTVKTRRG